MDLVQKIVSCLFPSRCLLCQKTVDYQQLNSQIEICSNCETALPVNRYSCISCALPLISASGEENSFSLFCGGCIKKLPAFDYSYSLFHYEAEAIRLIQQLKFSGKISVARTLSEMLARMLEQKIQSNMENTNVSYNKPDCLFPVPLHHSRLRQRGFNQSIEISRVISKKLNIPIDTNSINRMKPTTAQTGLNAMQRKNNIKGAFKINTVIQYNHVLIVDDVVTTGSTVNELAKLLKKNKVETVGVLSVARAPLKN